MLGNALAPFRIANFRQLWLSDALSLWGFEMETLILAWFVLVQTDSAFMVGLVGALRFGGTLISPWLGVYVDRLSKRSVMLAMRLVFVLVALALALVASGPGLEVWHALTAAAISGLLRPPEMVVRQALIADTMPPAELVNALGFSRITMDSSKIVGAIAGASAMAALGIDIAYWIITLMYLGAIVFTLRLRIDALVKTDTASRVFDELRAGFTHIRDSATLRQVMWLAVVANLTAFPLSQGLIPVVARDSFGLDEIGLANMVASVAFGALAGSVAIGFAPAMRPAPIMFAGLLLWHLLIAVFAYAPSLALGFTVLFATGLASTFAMISMSALLMSVTDPAFRGRVMGVRMLCVYSLPVGLLLGGLLSEWVGVRATLLGFGLAGALLVALEAWRAWRRVRVT